MLVLEVVVRFVVPAGIDVQRLVLTRRGRDQILRPLNAAHRILLAVQDEQREAYLVHVLLDARNGPFDSAPHRAVAWEVIMGSDAAAATRRIARQRLGTDLQVDR